MTSKIQSCPVDHVQRLKRQIPMNIDGAPAVYTERALKEQMEACFLRAIGT